MSTEPVEQIYKGNELSREEQLALWIKNKKPEKKESETPLRERSSNTNAEVTPRKYMPNYFEISNTNHQISKPTKKSLLSSTKKQPVRNTRTSLTPFKIPKSDITRKDRRVPYDPNMIKDMGLEKDFELHRFKYWTISDKCNRVLECESYLDGSRIFEEIERSNSEWLVDKAFFWVMWALFEEQFGRYDSAASLYERALKNKAKPLDLIQQSMLSILSRKNDVIVNRSVREEPKTEKHPWEMDDNEVINEFEELDDLISDSSEEESENQVTVADCRKVLRYFSSFNVPGIESALQHFEEHNDMNAILEAIWNSTDADGHIY